MTRKLLYILLMMLPVSLYGQHIQSHQLEENNKSGFGSGETFSPFKKNEKDSTKKELNVPKEIHQWHINAKNGEVIPIDADTMQHMFQNTHLTEGINGEYNFLGNMGTPRQTRIFFNRPTETTFDFLQPYDYFVTEPGRFIFTDTKSPYTNLTYHSSGNKVDGDDRFRAYFTTNAGKHFGAGFLFDYLYARGRYDNQASSQMNFSLFSFYRSDRYNYHLLASSYHLKQAENGGITDDRYITRPEETDGSNSNFGTTDIPVNFDKTWNRNKALSLYFTHNYNLGSYKEQAYIDTTGVATDSLITRFVPVARITHTADVSHNNREFINYRQPVGFYADTYLPYDSTDNTKHLSISNRIELSLCEGFSNWAFADIKAFASYRYNRYALPDTTSGAREYRHKYNEHILSVGGTISSNRWEIFRYKVEGEAALTDDDIGAFSIDGNLDFNFKLWKKDVKLKAFAFIKNNRPSFYYRHFHSEHYWWDRDNLDKEFKTRIGGEIHIPSSRTRITVGVENIKNYTYIANNSKEIAPGKFLNALSVAQESDNIQVLTATLKQDFTFGIFNLNTEFTYQNSSNKSVLPLPEFNMYANLFLKFKIAKVLNTEIGADVRYFTEYYAPDYSPALGQFVQQNQADKVAIGNYPIASVYANFLLKQTRFYVKYFHVNEGTGNRRYFLVPHYPTTQGVLWFGLSWNFYN